MEGRGGLTMASISRQDLRRRLYGKAKADKDWQFWGLYVHVAKLETLRAAYDLAKRNNGAPGIDGVTFEAIEAAGVEPFLGQLRDELVARTYRPLRNRRVEIPKDDGKRVRILRVPAIRDRVVQGGSHTSWSRSSVATRPGWSGRSQECDDLAKPRLSSSGCEARPT
jgi:RNA-directed DNA polymerase